MEKAFLTGDTAKAWGTIGARATGIACVSLGARDMILAANEDAIAKTTRNALRVAGCTHAAFGLWVADGIRRKEIQNAGGGAAVGVHAVLAAAALWRGFRKEDK
ncbi:hypothetical protein HYH03_005412 [Edaphochlamys debaryana]|nr:hypothetical protein HYH03_005412 [Edaphochlamys debaryana]|eukprot:KAG2496590.1 hypothetical protein HYH03_005412 [Edaphochlamys debaryana]